MKIFLAGDDFSEAMLPIKSATAMFHPYHLASYYHLNNVGGQAVADFIASMQKHSCELIVDSGVFTYMYGGGRATTDFDWWRGYVEKYLEDAKRFECKKTLVECDAQKIIGLDNTRRLRDLFRASKYDVMYVWHLEEGIDNLPQLAKESDYVGIGTPEMRRLAKASGLGYHELVRDLVERIYKANPKVKIHLLGNTVKSLIFDHRAYSCDSTSWVSGSRFGSLSVYKNGRMVRTDADPTDICNELVPVEVREFAREKCRTKKAGTVGKWIDHHLVGAWQFHLMQQDLDRQIQWRK